MLFASDVLYEAGLWGPAPTTQKRVISREMVPLKGGARFQLWFWKWRALSSTDNPQGRINVGVLADKTCRLGLLTESRGQGDRKT